MRVFKTTKILSVFAVVWINLTERDDTPCFMHSSNPDRSQCLGQITVKSVRNDYSHEMQLCLEKKAHIDVNCTRSKPRKMSWVLKRKEHSLMLLTEEMVQWLTIAQSSTKWAPRLS